MAVDLPLGWMRQIIGASSLKRPSQPVGCVGHFFDNEQKRTVNLDLGYVSVRCPFSYRSALSEDEPLNVLSWVSEGADQYESTLSAFDEFFNAGAAIDSEGREADPLAVAASVSGSYVIPGLTAMDGINQC